MNMNVHRVGVSQKNSWERDFEGIKEDLRHCYWADFSKFKFDRIISSLKKTVKRQGGIDYSAFPIDFRWHLCSSRLSQGKFDNWDGWEFRSNWSITFQGLNGGPSAGPVNKWTGQKVKHLVIASEQGIGDEILYSSAIPELIVRLGHEAIELQCHPRLFQVFRRSFRIKCTPRRVLSQLEPDVPVVALADLFMFYRKDKSHFPKKPFLKPDLEMRLKFLKDLGNYPKPWIGVGWKSRHGVLPLDELLSKLKPLGGTLFNLQYGDTDSRLVDIQPNPMEDMEGHINFISCLDRVVSVTQTVVHEAGGLGVQCDAIKPERGTGEVNPMLWYYGVGESPKISHDHLVYGNMKVWEGLNGFIAT